MVDSHLGVYYYNIIIHHQSLQRRDVTGALSYHTEECGDKNGSYER